MSDRHKHQHKVAFALTQKEFERLQTIVSQTGQTVQGFLFHFFESMASLPGNWIFLPKLCPFREDLTQEKFVRVSDLAYATISKIAGSRSISLGDVGRAWCLKCIELCEERDLRHMPEKGEIKRWLLLSAVRKIFPFLFRRRKL